MTCHLTAKKSIAVLRGKCVIFISFHRGVDDNHGKDEVTGSNPVRGSIFLLKFAILTKIPAVVAGNFI